ncbi:MAG: porin family protein [Bacteroidaceae bacterium]|nr:porin family protein [Bacteroidaceae bacterium]
MKKGILLMALMLVMAVSASAQQLKFGIEGGMNISSFRSYYGYAWEKPNGLTPGFQLGATVDWNISKHWVLGSGLTFMHIQNKMKTKDEAIHANIRLNRLVAPLKIGYEFAIGNDWKIMPSLGMFASYNIGGTSSMDYLYDGNGTIKHHHWNSLDGCDGLPTGEGSKYREMGMEPLRHFTYGGIAGVKATFKDHYTISLNYMEEMKRLHKTGLHTYNYSLSVGYKF